MTLRGKRAHRGPRETERILPEVSGFPNRGME